MKPGFSPIPSRSARLCLESGVIRHRPRGEGTSHPRAAHLFELGIALPTLLLAGWFLAPPPGGSVDFSWALVLWIAVVAAVDLLPVTAWHGLRVSVAFPVLMAVAFLYSPETALVVGVVGSCDPREFRREIALSTSAFNRAQIACAVFAASSVFHQMANIDDSALRLVAAAAAAVTADYFVNATLVTIDVSLAHGMAPMAVLKKLRIGNPLEFLVSYLGLGVLGVVLAKLYLEVGFWAVAVFIVPLILARQMFFRSRALEEAHTELEDRASVLRALSDRMAEERQDERAQIAAYLHDDLAQLLFRLSLQVDLASRFLDEDDPDGVRRTLNEVKETKNRTSDKIRSLIRDLHRSPLGRAGLAESLDSFTNDVGKDSGVTFELDVADLPLPPPIQLLTYQIAREAIMNALKYAEASTIGVTFARRDQRIELQIHDDGHGFDANNGSPDGHFGLKMMRERAIVAGGTFDLVSAKDLGTNVTVRFPSSWLEAEAAPEDEDQQPLSTS